MATVNQQTIIHPPVAYMANNNAVHLQRCNHRLLEIEKPGAVDLKQIHCTRCLAKLRMNGGDQNR